MPWNRFAVIVGLVGSLLFAGAARADKEQVGPWTVVTDGGGRIVSMSYSNPPTGPADLRMLEIDLGDNAKATRGRIEYRDGVKRDMSKEEVYYYYCELLDGPKAAWDYLAGRNQVTKYSPSSKPLPTDLNGDFVRVISLKGTNFFGTLAFESTSPTGFSLAVERASNGPIWFENAVVREVQVVR
jgi:hypothetical protein